MPSACTKPEKKASTEVETPIRQCLNVVEKKVRNLEKRKGKLDTYREKARDGTALNEDQKEAVGRYDSVVLNLEFARELQKQFVSIQSENEKLMKKQAKRESHERQQTEIRRIKELLSVQNLLDSMGAEDVRADFAGGSKGAVKLSEEELDRLDELYKLISPTRDEENNYTEQLTTASEHIVNFLEGRDKEVIGTTYKDLKAIVVKINDCGYFDAKAAATEPAEEEEEPAAAAEETTEAAEQEPAAAEAKVEETPDYTLQQLATESLPQQQPAAELDFAGDAAAASMLGQPQQSAPLQLDEPTTDATAPAAEDTFFSTQPFPQPRPFNEIVSSVTGTFDFLQDSQIEQAKNSSQQQQPMDPAVMAQIERGPPAAAGVSQQTKAAELSFVTDLHAAAASQYQTAQATPTTATQDLSDAGQSAAGSLQFSSTGDLQPQSSSAASSSQPPAPSSAFDDDPNSMYSAISQGLQNSGSASQFESQQPSSGFGADSGADSGPPQPIPMPGQYNTDPDQSSAAAAAAGHDRNSSRSQFANLNPNADIFQSMYTGGDQAQQQSGSSNFQQQSSGAAAAGADRQQAPQQAWGSSAPANDFQTQGYGGGQYGGRRGNQQPSSASAAGGGYRGQQRNGAGGPNNMNNGYRGGSNPRSAPGNQRGGNSRGSGGAYNSGAPGRNMQQQQGGPMRGPTGGNQGGPYKGYPPRNDYQPEGGYQGYNASSQGFMQSQQGGPRGGPRNSVPRTGGRGGGGNYGNRMTPQ